MPRLKLGSAAWQAEAIGLSENIGGRQAVVRRDNENPKRSSLRQRVELLAGAASEIATRFKLPRHVGAKLGSDGHQELRI